MDVTANPWTAADWNLTDQGAFIKKFGLAVAQRRMKEAGVKLGALRPAGPQQAPAKIYIIQGKPGKDGAGSTTPPPTPVSISEYLGFSGQGPFAPLERFDLAMASVDVAYPGADSATKSRAFAVGPPAADFTCVLVSDLNAYLADGSTVLASVFFAAGTHDGVFTYVDPPTILPANTTPWLVMPDIVDPIFESVQIVFVGDRQ